MSLINGQRCDDEVYCEKLRASENIEEDKKTSQKFVSTTSNLSPDEPNVLNWEFSNTLLDLELEEKSCITSYQEFDNTLDQVEYILNYKPKTDKNCKDAKTKKFDTAMGKSHQNSLQTIADSEYFKEVTQNKSLKLISTHLEPDITSNHTSPEVTSKAVSNTTLCPDEPNLFANGDDSNSFLNLENSCDTTFLEFDNTLEKMEYILENVPQIVKSYKANDNCKDTETKKLDTEMGMSAHGNRGKLALNLKPSAIATPMKKEQDVKIFATPSPVLQSKPSLYKTPLNPPVLQKPSTSALKKTPSKNPAFQHVASPVAYYINNSPRIPLMRNVHPKDTLPGLPSNRELVKTTGFQPSNKEYVNLPNVAYKSAKETRVIDVSNAPKMPQSQWAKKLTQSNPRPAVIKHAHREELINKDSKTTNRDPEDSFGNLSLHQAEISICTKKTL